MEIIDSVWVMKIFLELEFHVYSSTSIGIALPKELTLFHFLEESVTSICFLMDYTKNFLRSRMNNVSSLGNAW